MAVRRVGARRRRAIAVAALGLGLAAGASTAAEDAIDAPLQGLRGDAGRGRAIVADRSRGLCLLCHRGPFPEERFQGELAPDLAGAGDRWTEGQLRLRIVDGRRLNPASVMPSYHRVDGLERVAPAVRGRPILDAQQVEDVVAFLVTLREPPATGAR
ncbi:MAG: sulfur oxidation c-type cytochrome SoxX [Burkholderiales bacterium]